MTDHNKSNPPAADPPDALLARIATMRPRVAGGIAALERQDESLFLPLAIMVFAAMMIALGIRIEIANFSLGLSQQFPALSNGQSAAGITDGLQYALGAALLMVHVVMQQVGARVGGWFHRPLNLLGLLAVVLLVAGGMVFLAASIGQTSGDASVAGIDPKHGSTALGAILAALFPLSVISNHAMCNALVGALKKIVAITRRRRVLRWLRKKDAGLTAKVVAKQASERKVAELSKPDAPEWAAATETAAIVAETTRDVSDAYRVRRVVDAAPAKPGDVDRLPPLFRDMPIDQLRELGEYLAGFTTRAIFDHLKAMEA